MLSGSEVFGKWLSHEGRTLRNGISALMEEASESSLSPSFCYGGHREKMPNSEAESRPFSSVQSLSCAWLFATPWIAARQASLSNTNSRSSPRLTSIESVVPSSHLILWRPLLLLPPIPPTIRVFSNESTLRTRWPKYKSFSFSIIPSKEIPGLISFRMNWLDLLRDCKLKQWNTTTHLLEWPKSRQYQMWVRLWSNRTLSFVACRTADCNRDFGSHSYHSIQ